MTNELEKQFFDTFGIEPKKGCTAYDKFEEEEADIICNDKCAECLYLDDVYPQITSEILLELYCIVSDYCVITADSITELKEKILKNCIKLDVVKVDIKHQVQALFEEG